MPAANQPLHSIRPAVLAEAETVAALRRTLHQNPETAYKEFETAALAEKLLTEAGLPVFKGFGKTGLAAVWDSGRPGPTTAVRAEMDALNITEESGLPFSSKKPGLMHACGHDFHLALLLGVARLAAAGQLSRATGKVVFVCQPAEEGGAGARAMLEDGLFSPRRPEIPVPDRIFSCHGEPMLPLGRLIVNPGASMAGAVYFRLTVKGRGGHAAMPQFSHNPLPKLAELIGAVRAYPENGAAMLNVTMAGASERANVIADEAWAAGTLRYHERPAWLALKRYVDDEAAKVAAEGVYRTAVHWKEGYPPTVNNPKAAALVLEAARDFFGESAGPGPPSFASEDFSFFLERIPGAFFFFGTGGPGENFPLHSAKYRLNEGAVAPALEFWLRLLEKIPAR